MNTASPSTTARDFFAANPNRHDRRFPNPVPSPFHASAPFTPAAVRSAAFDLAAERVRVALASGGAL
jgi:hypothetical protein